MKLRLQGDTIRLRLTQGEVERLITTGSVEGATKLGSSSLSYWVSCRPEVERISVDFRKGRLHIALPLDHALRWSQSDEVSLQGAVENQDGSLTTALIEKDFACLSHQSPGDADCYPHPATVACSTR